MTKTIVFFSTKGGVGKTTIALNAAISLSQKGKKVLLLDMDLGAPMDMSRMCGVKPKKSMVDLFPLWINVKDDKKVIDEKFLTQINPNLDFLPAVKNLRNVYGFKDNYVIPTVEGFKKFDYDFIIIDGGTNLSDTLIKIFDCVNLVLLIVTPDVLSLYQTKWILDTLQSLGFPLEMIKGILNRAESKGGVSLSEIKLVLPLDIFSLIPSDGKVVTLALNREVPVILDSPKSKVSFAIDSLTKDLINREKFYVSHKLISELRFKHDSIKSKKSDIWNILGLGAEPTDKVKLDDLDDNIIKLKKKSHKALIDQMNLRRVSVNLIGADAAQMRALKEEAEKILANVLAKEAEGVISSLEIRRKLTKEIIDEALGLGPLEDLIKDDDITEIMVNNENQIYIEKQGRITLTSKRFTSSEQVRVVIERIIAPLGRRIDESSPYVDARLSDGSRVNAIIPPLSLTGPTLTIRKFGKKKLLVEDLIADFDSLTSEMATFLKASVAAQKNILVSGGTGSGKTTFLNILSEFIPDSERIITIEDSAELKLHQQHWIRLESRPPNIEGRGEIAIRDLFRNTLRMRPDRIIVGECRGQEILDMLQAMNTGHDGSMSTVHANSTKDVVIRLDSMILMSGAELPIRAIREMVSSAIDMIVHTARLTDGSRKVVQITEFTGMKTETDIEMNDIFLYKQQGVDENGKVLGYFTPTGQIPTFYDELCAKGLSIPKETFTPKASI